MQEAFLNAFFQREGASASFLLAGGTALAGFYLGHRFSDDIDLFTYDRDSFRGGLRVVQDCLPEIGLTLTQRAGVPERDDYVRCSLEGDAHPSHPLRKVELILDSPPLFGPPESFGVVRVMSLLDIAVAKILALGRRETRDYVDLYFIASSDGIDLDQILPLAHQKDPGFSEFYLAEDLWNVDALRGTAEYLAAYQIKPLDWDELRSFCRGFAKRLFDASGHPRS